VLRRDNQGHRIFVGGRLDAPRLSSLVLPASDDDELAR
jgi:hypothetical protein